MEFNLITATVFAEKLREDLFNEKPALIKTRRFFFRTYPNAFVGSEVVAWLLKNGHDSLKEENERNNNGEILKDEDTGSATENNGIEIDTETLVQAMQKLADIGIIYNVQRDAAFKGDNSIYRFTADDSSCPCVVEALVKGCRLHKTTLCCNCSLLQRVCEYGELISEKCMRGSDLVSWICKHGLAQNKEDALRVCKLMYEQGILKPATKHVTEFVDGRPFYLFGIDFDKPPLTIKQFVSLTNAGEKQKYEPAEPSETQNKTSEHVRQLSGQLIDMSLHEKRNAGRQKNTSSSSIGSEDSDLTDNSPRIGASITNVNSQPSYASLLSIDGKLTPEALLHPDAPFEKKELRIYPDPVGYGFIIRGESPCYVKIVDPESPAGKCGLKKHQYITEINNCDVTKKSYPEVEDLIINGPKFLMMTVMLPKEDIAESQAMNPRKYSQPEHPQIRHSQSDNSLRRQSVPAKMGSNWPTAQPWMKSRKESDVGLFLNGSHHFIR